MCFILLPQKHKFQVYDFTIELKWRNNLKINKSSHSESQHINSFTYIIVVRKNLNCNLHVPLQIRLKIDGCKLSDQSSMKMNETQVNTVTADVLIMATPEHLQWKYY